MPTKKLVILLVSTLALSFQSHLCLEDICADGEVKKSLVNIGNKESFQDVSYQDIKKLMEGLSKIEKGKHHLKGRLLKEVEQPHIKIHNTDVHHIQHRLNEFNRNQHGFEDQYYMWNSKSTWLKEFFDDCVRLFRDCYFKEF